MAKRPPTHESDDTQEREAQQRREAERQRTAPPNAIRQTKHARRDAPELSSEPAQEATTASKQSVDKTKPDRRAVPEAVRRRFTQVGNKYHFEDGALAFTDRGSRLTSPSENTEVIKSMIAVAQARSWADITLSGTERFRREAWYAGRLAGLEVRGYKASEYEQGRLVRLMGRAQQSDSKAEAPQKDATAKPAGAPAPRPRAEKEEGLRYGRLADHGSAPYQHDPKKAQSYFIRLETPQGDQEIWGVDLYRALNESATRPRIGDDIGLRSLGRRPVEVKEPQHDTEGHVTGHKRIQTHRNTWVVEKREFFKERAKASRTFRDARIDEQQGVKKHPELVGTYLQLHAAELAAKSIRDPEDQQRFVSAVRQALGDSIHRGEQLPPVRLKESAAERHAASTPDGPSPPSREPAPVR